MVESENRMSYDELAGNGRRVRDLVAKQARRPYVLEITGTPKAGKTSTIGLVASFFKDCGWRVHVVKERAAECPIPMKGHFFFNTWTTCTMLAEVLDVVDRDIDLVILDRGFFDALVWLELQVGRQQVTSDEARTFEQFVLLERWRRLVDATIVMTVSPAQAMKREQLGRLLPRRGSVMQESALDRFNAALREAREKHGSSFQLEDVDSETENPKEVAAHVLRRVLSRIEEWVDPSISVVSRAVAQDVFGSDQALRWPAGGLERLASSVQHVKRSVAEADPNLVQLVAGGVAKRDDGVFVFDRAPDQKRVGEYGQHCIWRGGHLVESSESLEKVAKEAVIERFQTNLHLSFDFEPQPLGIVWLDEGDRNPRSAQHLGILFEVRIADENVAQSLEDKEFRTSGRGHPATSRFTKLNGLREMKLESWSHLMVSAGWLGAAG